MPYKYVSVRVSITAEILKLFSVERNNGGPVRILGNKTWQDFSENW